MAKRSNSPLSVEKITDESRFLLKTLRREDLFGSVVSLSEAEKLLEPNLSLGFVEYCAFLKKGGYLDINRDSNTVSVSERGRQISEGMDDAKFHQRLAAHFGARIKRDERDIRDSAATSARGQRPKPVRNATPIASHDEATHAVPAPEDELVAGRYVRYDAIGQGGLGTVYRGKNVVLGHSVALKEIRHVFDYVSYIPREEILRRLRREVMAQAGLAHPHILAIHDVDFDLPYPYLIMDFAQGGSLKDRIFRAKTDGSIAMPVDISMRYLLQIAYGLGFAHSEGLVHGNLKPENILFDRMGNVKIADFGIARVTEKDSSESIPVYVGMGSPSYMAPEQLHDTDVIGPTADIYALGIMLYQMLTGQLPGRRSPMPSKLNPDASTSLDDLFDRMTRDSIEERYQNIDQVLDHIYQAFPADLVVGRGTLLLFENDPMPAPILEVEPEAEEDEKKDPDGENEAEDQNDETAETDSDDVE